MAFIVEDGTGLEDANAYVDVAYVLDYAARNNLVFSGTQEEQENAIIVATSYTDERWGRLFRGLPLVTTQALEFPRACLRDRYGRDITGIPGPFADGVSSYAITQLGVGTLYPNPPSGSAQEIKRTKIVVGPITTEKEYQGVKSQNSYLSHPAADRAMRLYTNSTKGVSRQ